MRARAACVARVFAAITVVTCALGYTGTSASAMIVHLKNGSAVSYQPLRRSAALKPFDEFFTNLDYNGGPVMASNTNYVIYWRPTGAGIKAYPGGYKEGIEQYLVDLAHDSRGHGNSDSVSTQYNDTAGEFANYNSHFGGAFEDTDPYPPNSCTAAPICIDDQQMRAELVKFAQAHGLAMDLAHEFFLLTPPEVEDCFEAEGEECSAGSFLPAYCAYHSAIVLKEGVLVYSNDPYVTENPGCDDGNHPNNKPSDGVIEGGLSHEHNESITDPEPNSGWTDLALLTGEIGDKCRTGEAASEFGTPLGEVEVEGKKYNYNQEINGHKYWYQQEWSNKEHKCLQRLTFNAAEAPTATFSGVTGIGDEVVFDATGSTAGSEVLYSWQFNDAAPPAHEARTLETKSLTMRHIFPTAGEYLVALTVLAGDGTSKGTAHLVSVGQTQQISFTSGPGSAAVAGPTYTVSAVGGGSGNPVTFTIDPSASSVCSISGATVSFSGVGNCVIDANQAGSTEYLPAPQAKQEFTVGPGSQQIRFVSGPPSSAKVGGPSYVVAATGGGSGTPVTFTIDPSASAVCSISGATVGFIGVGNCVIDANQAGNSLYNAALQVQQSFAVGPEEMPAGLSGLWARTAINARSGEVTVTVPLAAPGTLSWLGTFPNGKFGVFSASVSKCRKGYIKLAGRCRPATIVFAKGSANAAAAGSVTVTLKPSASARRALASARKRRKALVVTLKLTFKSGLGGTPVSSTIAITIRPSKK